MIYQIETLKKKTYLGITTIKIDTLIKQRYGRTFNRRYLSYSPYGTVRMNLQNAK